MMMMIVDVIMYSNRIERRLLKRLLLRR